MKVSWFGPFDDCSAFGLVNTRFTESLQGIGVEVLKNSPEGDVLVSSTYPPQLTPFAGPKALFTVWEFGGVGAVPSHWKAIAREYNSTITNSKWVGRVFVANGIHDTCTVRACIPEHKFYPKPIEHEKFRFLWAGGSDPRHGLDVVLEVFNKEFKNVNDVELWVKIHPFYPYPRELLQKYNSDNINVIYKKVDMFEVYNSCDCLVLPMRGTSKSFVALEAMACGLPAILTAGSGLLALTPWGYPLLADLKPTQHHIHKDTENLWWFEPNREHLASLMKFVYLNRSEAKQKGLAASEYVRSYFGYGAAGRVLARVLGDITKPIKVSIVILCHPRPEPVLPKCIDSIIEHTSIGYEIIIIDNGVPDWEFAVDNATKHPYNQIYRFGFNSGVARGRNKGLELARGEYTLFLDDDAEITRDGWLEEMLSYFSDPRVGLVGQTGYYIKEWGLFWEAQGVTECDVVQGYCQLFPTRFRQEIGYLDENYGQFWHEDADWSLTIRSKGYKVIDCDNVGVAHAGSMSGDDGTYMKKLQYLTRKWNGRANLVRREDWHKAW